MGNAMLFTACLLGAAVLGGFVGACCSKGRQAGDHEGRIADLEDRLDALAVHVMEESKRLRTDISDVDIRADELHDHVTDLRRILNEKTSDLYDRVSVVADDCDKGESALDLVRSMDDRLRECELLIGETPTGGLLGRVGALEDAQKTHEQDAVIVNGWADEIKALKKGLEGLRMANDEEHRVLRDVLLALNKHGHGCVVGLEAELSRKKEAKGGC